MATANPASPLDRWQQIETLFAQARVLPPGERAAFLDTACEDDTLRADLDRLLASHDQADNFLSGLDTERASALLTEENEQEEESLVGPYRLVREVGRGGMGAVYLAERATGQFQQQVALKLIKRGMDSDAILRRFLHERQILARLHHPSIARLYDGDVTDDGRPYFAMEYVEGTPLTTYCDAHRLDIDARLRLFQEICRAVQYAHQNLVVHRDLKPSNMLVTEAGELKLLDFGIARLLDEDGGGTVLTEAGYRMMTPEYAAPEQVQGGAITTATDVYALGVLLYELLTGHRPYQFEQRTPDAMARHLAETDPERPSTVVRRTTESHHSDGTTETITPEAISQKRGLAPDRLRQRLSGDLDAVLLKALRKEPDRRYASAEAFLEDIKRHLAGLPVQARPDAMGYRIRKFMQRHRTGVVAATLVVLALLGGLGAALWQANVARQEAATATAVSDFVVRLFEEADPDASPGEDVTARALLERSPEQIERELAGQPKTQAEMLEVVSRLHMALGLYEETEPILQQALALRRAHFGPTHPETAETLSLLGSLASSQSQYDDAETHLRDALQMQQAAYGLEHLEVALTQSRLGTVFLRKDKLVEAESLNRQVLATRHRFLPPAHPDLADAMTALAYVLRRAGNYGDEPDSLYHHALTIQQQYHGDLHSATLEAMSLYSNFLQDKGDLEQAEALSRQELDLARQLYGEEHPSTGHSYHTLGRLMSIQGHAEAADSLYRAALRVYRATYGNEHAYVGVTLSNLGAVQIDLEKYDEAEWLLREALDVYRKRYGPEHWYIAISTNELARLAKKTGDEGRAEQHYREALALFRTSRPPGHPITGTSLQELGALLLKQGLATEAEPLLREAEESWAEAFEDDDWRLLTVRQDLGACLLALERFKEAETILLHIYPILEKKHGPTGKSTTATRQTLADLYTAWGKPEQATRYLENASSAPTESS